MPITYLILLNIPAYLFIGWLVFDTKDDAATTFFDTTVALLKAILIPRIIRVLMGDVDDDGTWGIVPIFAFFFACGGLVWFEHYLLTEVFVAGG